MQLNFPKTIIYFFSFVVITFCFFLGSTPAFAVSQRLLDIDGEILDMKIDSDGTFNVYVNFFYTGAPGDDLSDIEFTLRSFPDPDLNNTKCYLPDLTPNPGTAGKVVIVRCDFRDAGIAPGTYIQLYSYNNAFGDKRTYTQQFPFQNRIGSNGEQYFSRVYPLGLGKYTVEIGGATSSRACNVLINTLCNHRVRVLGKLGAYDSWDQGYSCTDGLDKQVAFGNALGNSFECDFTSFLARGETSLTLGYYIGSETSFTGDTPPAGGPTPVSVYSVDLSAEKGFFVNYSRNSASSVPNDLFANVTLYQGYGNVLYTIKLKNSSGALFSPRNNCTATSVDSSVQTINAFCDFSQVDPSGTYSLSLRNPAGNEIDSMDVILEDFDPASSGGTCSCQFSGSSCVIQPAANACSFGYDPKITLCGDPADPICTCGCSLNGRGVVPGGLPPLTFDLDSFAGWAAKGQQYIIAFGIFASIFIVPYFGVLLASGNPESIKEGLEWAKSWAFGLLLLLLSSLVIRIIGSDILGF